MQESIENIIHKEFEFIKCLVNNDDKSVTVLRHNQNNQKLLRITHKGNGDVYKILQKISSPNLPRIYSVTEENNTVLVYEEYIDGISVSDVLTAGHYDEDGVRVVIKELCSVLCILHSHNIIHRDIKPENVIITNSGDVVLVDFDAARIHKDYKSADTKILGTTGFAAPEQYGFNQTDLRTDIFSLGILMNVMLTGNHPSKQLYQGNLTKIIEKCINTDPNQRYNNTTELHSVL